jgi:hypothetical protein
VAQPIIADSTTQWLTAVGTVLAVVVAVFLQAWITWRTHRRQPKLTLARDDYAYSKEANKERALIPYLRLAVTNASGKHAAEAVEVLVLRIDGGPRGSGGVNRWLVNPALGWPNSLDPLPRMTIPPGTTRYIDVGYWSQSGQDGGLPRWLLELAVQPRPYSDRHILEPGEYVIELAVAARNADATKWRLGVAFEAQADSGLEPGRVEIDMRPLAA